MYYNNTGHMPIMYKLTPISVINNESNFKFESIIKEKSIQFSL